MHLDVFTTLVVSGIITAGIGIATVFFSLAREENHSLLWAAVASAGFATCMFLAALRGRISDFLSIIVVNELLLFFLIAYFEAFCRQFAVRPRARRLVPWLLVGQLAFFLYYTYYQPNFQARVLVLSTFLGIMCLCSLKLLLSNVISSHRAVLIFTTIPFFTLLSICLFNFTLFLLGVGLTPTSFKSSDYAFSIVGYCVCAIWISLSALIIVSDKLQTQVIHMSLTDPLTGALNRRALEDAAKREIARSNRSGSPLSMIMADLDHFKGVNDTYGHQAGDALLSHIFAKYQKLLRGEDVLARYGGDELVILLPNTDLGQALQVAERLRGCCEAGVFRFNNRSILATSSFGVVGYDPRSDDYDSLVKHADEALYRAKDLGRNRVRAFQAPEGQGKE